MASDHRGNHVHAGKRTDDEIMANPFYNAGDPLLQKATMDRMLGDYPSMEKQAPVGNFPNSAPRSQVPNSRPSTSVPNSKPMGRFQVPNSKPVGQTSVPNSKPSSVKAQADEIMGYETGKVPPMVTAKGVKEAATTAGSKIANSGYGSAAMAGAAAGGVFLGGGINLAAGEVGHPAENLPVMNTPQVAKGMVAGAAIGVAGKFINDTRKMSKGSRSNKK
jgi:hypothetical protein